MNVRFLSALLGSLLLLSAVRADPSPPTVAYLTPVVRPGTNSIVFTGRTESAGLVELRARVTGYLEKVHFKDGSEVREGDVLFEIDPRPYQAALKKAEADLAIGQATLARSEADLLRMKALPPTTVSREEVDRAQAERDTARASIDARKAAIEMARINLSFTRILAPMDGRISQRLVDVGTLVRADETILATVIAKEVRVAFDVDERTVLKLRRIKPDKAGLPVQVGLIDEIDFPHAGQVDFVDVRVDAEAGKLRMRARVGDPKNLLLPGLRVRIRLSLGEARPQFMVPQRVLLADVWSRDRAQVLVIGEGNRLEKRTVVLGWPVSRPDNVDDLIPVDEGLTEKDRIIDVRSRGLPPLGTVVTPHPESR